MIKGILIIIGLTALVMLYAYIRETIYKRR